MKPTLILLSDSYPLSAGEFFLDDEIRIIHQHFEKIYVLIKNQETKKLNRYIPDNLEILKYNPEVSVKQKLKAIPKIFSPLFLGELFRAIFKYKLKPKPILFKIMFMDIVLSSAVITEIQELISVNKLDINKTIFYSYWHDHRALALARMTKKQKLIHTISRAHGWDVFKDRHNPKYLPFKRFILNNLTNTFSVSETGAKEFLLYTNKHHKISISKLGTRNPLKTVFEKSNNSILLCSCSNIIPLKRIEKIISLISLLKLPDLSWVHFGDGYLREELEQLAKDKLSNVDFEFRGIVPNKEILDFYSQNYVDLFINLSESEGIPVSIMEALSAGIPVLATDVGGTSEAVNNDNGFLVPMDFDIYDVAKIVRNYLTAPSEKQVQYRKNAYRFRENNFEAKTNYTKFVTEILNLIKP